MRVVGLMSGTSFDGVDAAVVDFSFDDGTLTGKLIWSGEAPMPSTGRDLLMALLPPASVTIQQVTEADTYFGHLFAEAASWAVEQAGGADAVCSHGQTVFHWVEDGAVRGTLQIGQPAWIAEATGLPVVADIRARDIAAGGQGAPLVSFLDALLLADVLRAGQAQRPAALNLGGIANVTVVDAGNSGDPAQVSSLAATGAAHAPASPASHATPVQGADTETADSSEDLVPALDVTAWDIGPANALIDAYVSKHALSQKGYDEGGILASRGRVNAELLDVLLEEPYYARPAPKSTGKELFHIGYVETAVDQVEGPAETLADVDVVATLTELTARTVAFDLERNGVDYVAVSGGGARNPVLMTRLQELLPGTQVVLSDDVGAPADAKEAILCALIGWCTLHGSPAVLPGVTGADAPRVLGSITPGAVPLELPKPVARVQSLRLG